MKGNRKKIEFLIKCLMRERAKCSESPREVLEKYLSNVKEAIEGIELTPMELDLWFALECEIAAHESTKEQMEILKDKIDSMEWGA